MREWLLFALLALVVWGFWGFFPKLASNRISPQSAILYDVIGALIVAILFAVYLVLFSSNFRLDTDSRGATFAILTGIAGTVGTLFLFFALRRGAAASVVVPMTALYPLATILLAHFVLKEQITVQQGIGILLALIAIALLSLDSRMLPDFMGRRLL